MIAVVGVVGCLSCFFRDGQDDSECIPGGRRGCRKTKCTVLCDGGWGRKKFPVSSFLSEGDGVIVDVALFAYSTVKESPPPVLTGFRLVPFMSVWLSDRTEPTLITVYYGE
jgi:hypothetical protein